MKQENTKPKSPGLIKRQPFVSTALLIVLLGLVLYSVIGLIADEQADELFPKARDGVIELDSVDLTNSSSVPLIGSWQFYWEKLLSYEQISETTSTPVFASVPQAWLDMPTEGSEANEFGYATYKLTVKVAQNTKQLALSLPTIGSAFRLYINDKLLAYGGVVGETSQKASPGYEVGIYTFDVPASSFDIIVQVSNHDLIWGGMWEYLRLGTPAQLNTEQSLDNFRSSSIIAILLTIAAFNLIQFSLRTLDRSPLIISIVCILLAVREIERSQLLAHLGIYSFNYSTNILISFLTFYLGVAFIVAYFYFSFKQEYNKWVIYTIFTISGLFSFHALVSSTAAFSLLVPYFQMLTVAFILYLTWGLILAAIRKRTNANLILLGTMLLFSLIINDLLISLRIIEGVLLVSFGLIGLIMCQNYATYRQFITAGEENKHLSIELGDRNVELQKFSKSLEDLVASRTSELSNANEKLEILAFQDSLTGVLNRRGLLKYIESAKDNFEIDNTPFCLILIDFDYFKKLNDTLGHEVGDRVLVDGSQKMTSTVRAQDNVGRWGGEEFLILLNNTTISDAKDIADGVRVVISELLSQNIGTKVTVSIGVSQFLANETIEKSINRADEALYRAKDAGRNCVELAE